MESLEFQSNKSNFYSNMLRIGIGFVGLMYLIPALQSFFTTYELTGITILNTAVGLIILLVVIFNPTFGANIKLSLNDEYLRSEEDMAMIRTAYWSKIDRLTLTRISMRITYQSGASERFRLPFVSSDEHGQLKKWVQQISHEHKITFIEKAWWKPF